MSAASNDAKERNKVGANARTAALVRLSKRYPDDFGELLDEERGKRGLPAVVNRRARASA